MQVIQEVIREVPVIITQEVTKEIMQPVDPKLNADDAALVSELTAQLARGD